MTDDKSDLLSAALVAATRPGTRRHPEGVAHP